MVLGEIEDVKFVIEVVCGYFVVVFFVFFKINVMVEEFGFDFVVVFFGVNGFSDVDIVVV